MLEMFGVSCHCGRLRARVGVDTSQQLWAWDCDCSDCRMRGNVHLIVPQECLMVDANKTATEESWEEATTLYQWGTKQAVRRFCKTCGILPWYIPRSDPDCFAVTIECVDWTQDSSRTAPRIEILKFDGVHWEESMAQLRQSSQSQRKDAREQV